MTYFETPGDALEHYGRKGMKWGVRRTREQLRRDPATLSARDERRVDRGKAPRRSGWDIRTDKFKESAGDVRRRKRGAHAAEQVVMTRGEYRMKVIARPMLVAGAIALKYTLGVED